MEEPLDRALHVNVDPLVDGVLLQGADHLQAGAVAHVGEARVAMAAEVPLENESLLGAVEQGAPFLQLKNPLGSLLRVDLGHAPVVEHLAAAHRVAEVDLPVVLGVDVAHRGGDAALGHHRVGFAEERFANQGGLDSLGRRFDRRAQSGAAGADHDNIVLVALVFFFCSHQNSLKSTIIPVATRRT